MGGTYLGRCSFFRGARLDIPVVELLLQCSQHMCGVAKRRKTRGAESDEFHVGVKGLGVEGGGEGYA